MDKESEESMAPALHTADHEAAGTIINMKFSSSSSPTTVVQSESDIFEQYNGVFSSHGTTDNVKSEPIFDRLKYESPSKTLQIGSSGDFGRMVPYLHDATASKINSIQIQLTGSGDTSKVVSKDLKSSLEESNHDKLKDSLPEKPILDGTKNTPGPSVTESSESCKLPTKLDKNLFTFTLPLTYSNALTSALETNSFTTQMVTNKMAPSSCPSLLVNVDKHESRNPQIIHTTSITTSALAISDVHKLRQEKDVQEHANGTYQLHHKHNLLKYSFSTAATHSTAVERERTNFSSAESVADVKVCSECGSPNQEIDLCNNNGVKTSNTTVFPGDMTMQEEPPAYSSTTAEYSADSKSMVVVSTISSTLQNSSYFSSNNNNKPLVNSLPLAVTQDGLVGSETVDSTSCGAISRSLTNVSRSNVIPDAGRSTLHNFTKTLETCTFPTACESLTTCNSSQAIISSVTQTTPVYHHHNSISAACVQEKSLVSAEETNNIDLSMSVPVTKPENFSLQNVPDLHNLAHDLVSGQHMGQLPTNVTNTLQELAASLTQTQEIEKERATFPNTALDHSITAAKFQGSQNTNGPTSSNYQYMISNLNDIESQQKYQHLSTVKYNSLLDNRIASLQLRLNKLRSVGVSHHGQRHLPEWKSPRTLPAKSHQKSSPVSRHALLKSGELAKHPHSYSKFNEGYSDTEHKSESREQSINASPKAKDTLGVLKKELNDSRKRLDPNLTDNSSDEEDADAPFKKPLPSLELTSMPGSFNHVESPAAWRWGHDRLSIAQRWTWLNAQVTGLEFKIKQHRDLHRQLREAKGEVKLSHQTVSHNQAKSNERLHIPTTDTEIESKPQLEANSSCIVKEEKSETSSKTDVANGQSTCARVRPLSKRLPHRRVLRTSDVTALSDKKLKPPTVHSNNDIMKSEQPRLTPYHRLDGRSRGVVYSSMRSRAALHDHSYHKILSTSEDIPISSRSTGHLLSSNKQFALKLKKMERRSDKRNKRKQKEAKQRDDRLQEKIKSRPRSATVVLERADKLLRSISTLQRNTSYEDRTFYSELKKRRSTTSLSEVKRSRIASVDSDAESLNNRSDAGTPVFDASASYSNNPQYQAVLKRKRANDQAYDINNIVIPHGLTTARIEKLQYKEILTPGWRTTKPQDNSTNPPALPVLDDSEDVSDEVFKIRHDRHEILEKKKYMNFLEMNINKRNGARTMSRANLPLDDPTSFFLPSRSSPTSVFPPSEFSAPASPEPFSPSVVLRSRRSSSELSLHSNASSQPAERQHRIPDSVSSEEGGNKVHRENSTFESWDSRGFPLTQHEVDEMTNDPVVFIKKLPLEANQMFHPISDPAGVRDVSPAPRHKPKHEAAGPKRDRINSHASSVSRDDDRHSDDSVKSSRSLHRVRSNASDLAASVPERNPEGHLATPVPERNPEGHLYSQRKRHKATLKDDFYYYSNMDTSSGSDSDSDSDASSNSKASKTGEQWVSRPVSRDSTPKRSTSGDDQTGDETSPGSHPPLLLKVKKKFIFK